jgi:glycosyltransferase involved in cell wall biosynthesis
MSHGSTTPIVSRAHGIAVLIAKRDRDELLRSRALPSLARQTRVPDYVVVVNDGAPLEPITASAIERVPVRAAPSVLTNGQARGVAGAWNSGLAHLSELGHSGYVALLDDDDECDPDHLAMPLT